ncbi:MAG: multidrug efflux RND transporter permease subunit [Desulfoferrobacter sp.]
MLSRYFIERPIFANVIAIVTIILGLIAYFRLPVTQFPEITPPTIQVTTFFPGASARTLVETVARPIEQAVNGVESMIYMKSTSSSNGSYSLTVTFELGTDIDFAQILVQNRVSTAIPLLPTEVQRQGVTTKKVATAILQVINLTSPDGRYDSLYMSNYALINLKDELARLTGVGDVRIFGVGEYAMRIWLDPNTLQTLNLTPIDVITAIQGQNIQVAAGEIGGAPAPPDQRFQYNVQVHGRLAEMAQFEDIIVKSRTQEAGRIVRVKDLGRVELGAQTYSQFNEKNGQPAAGIGIFQLPGANALQVAEKVQKTMQTLGKSFPAGLEYSIPFDTTKFVRASINEVYRTLFEAAFLVLLIIMVFIQSWRAMIVPATTVPVTIIGAFIAIEVLGFTINMETMFALVLAVGIVVDDAIVIVEGASYHIEEGNAPKQAAIHAMDELAGPIYGITFVLMAVFLPAALMSGVTGHLYRQFALVIAATALISAVNALTLQPAQCSLYLSARKTKPNFFFRAFNSVYDRGETIYLKIVGWMVRRSGWMLILYAVLILLAVWLFMRLPKGFLPTEDQGYIMIGSQLPDASSLERTHQFASKLNNLFKDVPGVKDWVTVGGVSLLQNLAPEPNSAVTFVILENWDKRGAGLSVEDIRSNLEQKLRSVDEAITFVALPPAIQGLGQVSGFQMEVQLKGGSLDFDKLSHTVNEITKEANSEPGLIGVTTTFSPNVPQLFADVDRTKAEVLQVPVIDVFNTIHSYLGSFFVNQFNRFGRTFQVYVQADMPYRLEPEDIRKLYVRNLKGEMVPLGSVLRVSFTNAPSLISLYDLYPSAFITGHTTSSFSTGQALDLLEEIAQKKMPPDMGFKWTTMSYQEKLVGHQAIFVFALSVLMVFLVLAAQYESWANPAAVILAVPLAVLGIALALTFRAYSNNMYTQIGVVLLIALSSKNAILIVDYARKARASGSSITDAAVEASRRRLRPILMTSFAFIFGVIPLALASGAGAISRRQLGTTVIGGMLASTLLAVLFVPVFFVLTQRLSEWWENRKN